ncbi:hypothetical protein PHLGIDRAFT_105227 [Phlebiopsis gigantea 11061_1 CR5-6]|uniref:Major facilitator superfamily (MFS) profile domain-containing protein n=1 Tax=Phlebiopsis gigantea (strain 11061_1 CR5-6) TaxID=745531 RepID=A0A0C3RZF2_PHLG1|nr:hypothetical protein PHLGIDRAFT_105227 [Phlebiopsis gigantea 11061_1 CR5-6]
MARTEVDYAPTRLSRFQNIRVYWLAFVVYWGIVLFGYDTGIGGGVVAQPYFQQHFGFKGNTKRANDISSNVVSVLQAGAFFGALGSAPISSYIGRKYTLFAFSVLFSIGAVLQTIAGGSRGIGYIYGGRVVAGVGIGAISAVAPAFVSECSPKEVRGRITGMFQIMVAVGVMLSYWINLGVSLHIKTGFNVWRIPLGIQLVPAGMMAIGLLTVKESPRWLASKGRDDEALRNLAYLRRLPLDHNGNYHEAVLHEYAEIEAAIKEEQAARQGLGLKEAFLGKGNWIRFVIAIVIFCMQQWCGQNSVNYYAPQIFQSIGYSGTSNSLLASGVYGIVKLVATSIFVFFLVESLGRKLSLFISAVGMGSLFFIIGALLKTFPPPTTPGAQPPPASKAMAAMLYIYVCFYSMGWGPLPWVYVSDIFPTRTRHFGLATASASQWFFNFIVSKWTPAIKTALGYKMFFMFAAINIGGMAVFSLLIPETKGRSLEEMDIIFGSVQAETRRAGIEQEQREIAHAQHPSEGSVRSEMEKV